jgi:hypothetical protein
MCGVATSVAVPAVAAVRASVTLASRSSGPSSSPGEDVGVQVDHVV